MAENTRYNQPPSQPTSEDKHVQSGSVAREINHHENIPFNFQGASHFRRQKKELERKAGK